jgi:putative ABC transport system permease protein
MTRLRALLRNLLHRPRVDQDLDAELKSYVDQLTAEKIRAGADPHEARRAAIAELGGIEPVKEGVRDVRAGAVLDVLSRDVRFAARSLARTPSFTIAAILALALGIGANTAILSVVDAVLLRPLAYADADRLGVILHGGVDPVSPANFADWRRTMQSYTGVAAAEAWGVNLGGIDEPERLTGIRVTAEMFPLLGVRPQLGRVFTPGEDRIGSDHVVVISHQLWQRRFGGVANVVGKEVLLESERYTIVGVMPPSFQFAPFWITNGEIWAPLSLETRAGNRGSNSLRVFARLRDGIAFDQAREELRAVTSRLDQEFPGSNRDVQLVPLKERVVGNVRGPLVLLLVAVSFVLLIACANVGHMLLARAAARQRELAVRTALGATMQRLVAQLLVESLLLAAGGAVVGLGIAAAALRALAVASTRIPRIASVGIDGRVLLMTIAITAVAAIVFGLAPALRAAKVDLAGTFRDGDRASTEGRGRHRLRNSLIASEFALAFILLVGAGLLIRSFVALRQVDTGFDARNVVTMSVSVSGTRFVEPSLRVSFFDEVLARVRALPGVGQASYINHLPLAGDSWGFSYYVEGRARPKPGEAPGATYRVVFPEYFRTMRLPLVAGREFNESDRLDAPRVIIINEHFAKKQWPGETAIGKRVTISRDTTPITVVGVAKNDVTEQMGAPPTEEMFFPYLQQRTYLTDPASRYAYMTLVVRAACDGQPRCDATALAAPITTAIRGIERGVAISAVQSMENVVDRATAGSQFYVVLLTAFAAIALSLAAVGIYGVMSYSVSRRTNEIGIRIALGAEPGSVVRFIVSDGMRIVASGAGAGLIGAFALTRLMAKLRYGVGATDPVTFIAVPLVLCTVALVASYLPARRAAKVDPLTALRAD